jgi:serine/threonine-protein kinase
MFLIVIGVVIWLVIPKGIAVPDVSTAGLTYDAAAKQITDAGLTPKQNPTPATSGAPGTVVSQNPAAGAKVDKGSDVTLTVAQAATPMITVPDVASQGISFDTAVGILSVGHLNAIRKDVPATGKAPGTVLAQDPAANAQVPATTKDVTLSVDQGVSVPDVSSQSNLSFQEAFNKLDQAGLSIGTQTCRFDTAHVGMVVDQNPKQTVVEKGRKVALVLGSNSCFHWRPFDVREISHVNTNVIHH